MISFCRVIFLVMTPGDLTRFFLEETKVTMGKAKGAICCHEAMSWSYFLAAAQEAHCNLRGEPMP